jgi:hypothetical protein
MNLKKNIYMFLLSLTFIVSLVGCDYQTPAIDTPQDETQISDNTVEEIVSKPELKIIDDWEVTRDGDYIYIKGRIKNIGKINVEYWKLTAEFLDKDGNVLDTDYTNSLEIMRPDNQKEFEIMHEYDPEYAKFRIFIEKAE